MTGGAALVVGAALALGLAGCGDDGAVAGSGATAVTAPSATVAVDDGTLYVAALDEGTRALVAITDAILGGRAAEGARRAEVEAGLVRLEAAGATLREISLDDPDLEADRARVVEAVPAFTAAMREVLAAGDEDPVNGGLELVQRREPILEGVRAMLAADAGAVAAFGEAARTDLETAWRELQDRLTGLQEQASS